MGDGNLIWMDVRRSKLDCGAGLLNIYLVERWNGLMDGYFSDRLGTGQVQLLNSKGGCTYETTKYSGVSS